MSDTPRAIIQIAVASGTNQAPDVLYALADDGTVWRLSLKLNQAVWYLLPPLPAGRPPATFGGFA